MALRKFLPLVCDLPRFSPFKSSKPMAESRCHGNCLTARLMEWSLAPRLSAERLCRAVRGGNNSQHLAQRLVLLLGLQAGAFGQPYQRLFVERAWILPQRADVEVHGATARRAAT